MRLESFVESFILMSFDVFQYYLIIKKLGNLTRKIKIPVGIILVVFLLLLTVCEAFLKTDYRFLILSVLTVFLYWIFYKKSVSAFIYLHMVTTIIMVIVQVITFVPVKLIFEIIRDDFTIGVTAQTISFIIVLVVVKFIPINLLYHSIKSKNNAFKMLILYFFAGAVFLAIEWGINYSIITEHIDFLLILVGGITVGLVISVKEFQKNMKCERYSDMTATFIDDLRVKLHDQKNHLYTVNALLETKKTQAEITAVSEEYISNIEEVYECSDLVHLENKVVSGFLYYKKQQSIRENIKMEIEIEGSILLTKLSDYELINIFSVLLDNAFETGIEGNVINVFIGRKKGRSIIEVANKYPTLSVEQMNSIFKKGYSTKAKQGRGIGLYKLSKILSKGHGEISIANREKADGNYVVFEVMLQ